MNTKANLIEDVDVIIPVTRSVKGYTRFVGNIPVTRRVKGYTRFVGKYPLLVE